MKYCPNCGKELDDNSVFCSECGQKIKNIVNKETVSLIGNKTIKSIKDISVKILELIKTEGLHFLKFHRKKLLIIGIAFIILITSSLFVFRKSDEDKIIELTNNLAAAMNEGDYDKMISCFEPKAQKQIKVLMDTANSLIGSVDLTDLWSLGSIEMTENEEFKFTIYELDINGDTAEMEISADYSMGYGSRKDKTTIGLIKIDGKWYFEGDLF